MVREQLEQDLQLFEGVVLNPHIREFDLEMLEYGEWWNQHAEWLELLAHRIRILARAERSVALHRGIVSECTTAKERVALCKEWARG